MIRTEVSFNTKKELKEIFKFWFTLTKFKKGRSFLFESVGKKDNYGFMLDNPNCYKNTFEENFEKLIDGLCSEFDNGIDTIYFLNYELKRGE